MSANWALPNTKNEETIVSKNGVSITPVKLKYLPGTTTVEDDEGLPCQGYEAPSTADAWVLLTNHDETIVSEFFGAAPKPKHR